VVVLVTETDISVPKGWERVQERTQDNTATVTYRHESNETKFIVSVTPKRDGGQFEIQLSTINRESTRIRHDYAVAEYDARATALEKAQSFLEILSHHLQDGAVSHNDPEIGEVQAAIQSFRENQRPPFTSRLFAWFR
jgi:hypothetical protein